MSQTRNKYQIVILRMVIIGPAWPLEGIYLNTSFTNKETEFLKGKVTCSQSLVKWELVPSAPDS